MARIHTILGKSVKVHPSLHDDKLSSKLLNKFRPSFNLKIYNSTNYDNSIFIFVRVSVFDPTATLVITIEDLQRHQQDPHHIIAQLEIRNKVDYIVNSIETI